MTETKERKKEESVIDVEGIVRETNDKTRGVRKKAWIQLVAIAIPYVLIISFIIYEVVKLLKTAYNLGRTESVLIAMAIFGIWIILTLVMGHTNIDTNKAGFIRTFRLFHRAISHGLNFYFWPIEKLHPLIVKLKDREVETEAEIELQRTDKNPRNWIKIKCTLIFRVTDLYAFVFLMAGDTAEEKESLIKKRFNDRFQSFVNTEKKSEDDVVELSGTEIKAGIEKVGFTIEDWGVELRSVELEETESSEETKAQRAEEYGGVAEGEKVRRKIDSMAKTLFGCGLEELTEEQRRELRSFYLSEEAIKAVKPSDKTIFGGPESMKKRVMEELVAENVEGD